MASKGESKTQKKISVSSVRKVMKKTGGRLTVRSRPGAHSKESSVPLGFAVRDLIGLAQNSKEARAVLNSGAVKVNGIARKEHRFNLGLFDILDIEITKQRFRAVLDSHGRLVLKEIPQKGPISKLCKVISKKTAKGGVMQITMNDGTTIIEKKTAAKVGDSIKLELPQKKVSAIYHLHKGCQAYITGGSHVGMLAKVADIVEGTMRRPRLVSLEAEKGSFLTIDKNVFVVGENKAEIDIVESGD